MASLRTGVDNETHLLIDVYLKGNKGVVNVPMVWMEWGSPGDHHDNIFFCRPRSTGTYRYILYILNGPPLSLLGDAP
ncbi:hypothetical protein CI610_02890 [invertebrate metagenome]|uniref:Uncharacterized protein n=1 Tax=invertebrate metagenome TaxID=1711999 RepID=A0A2H9T4Q0_9ZZZZ